jgi:sigma-B regulation protein RsbU (phosphoserine phosphatase)
MPRLVVINGPEAGRAFELVAPETIIGRQTGTEIQLEGQKVSRRHARIFKAEDDFNVEDLESSNGTFLNGKKLQAATTLQRLDELGIGPYVLRFETGDSAPEITIRARTAANPANAELYQGNAAHKLQVILRLSSDLGRSLDLDQLLTRVLDHLFILFPQAERALVILLEEGRPFIRAQKQRAGQAEKAGFSASIVHRVAAEGVGILAEDLQTDSRFADAQSIVSLGVRSFICVPLPTKSAKALGVLQLDRMARGHQFTAEDLNLLTTIGLQVSVALENAQLHQELLARQRIENEVALAREIQLSYLPTQLPHLPHQDFELYAELVPANEISGDFYDYFSIGANRLAITVADVCGKGIPAALFMSMVRALLRNLAEQQDDPGILLRELNNAVAQQNPKCQFVTLSFCVFDPSSQSIEVASAGHPSPLIRRNDGFVEAVTIEQGPLLGFMDREACYPKMRCQMHPGDLLLLYTDGVTEAPAPDNTMFGPERLRDALAATPFPGQLSHWTESLRKAIGAFTGARSQEDDITLALLRVR